MTSERTIDDALRDMAATILKAQHFVEGVTYREFAANEEKVFAVIRALEIIGEAAKQIPDSIRADYADIPWRAVAGMRDKLIHEYFGVNSSMVWQTIQEDLPQLYLVIARMLNDRSHQAFRKT